MTQLVGQCMHTKKGMINKNMPSPASPAYINVTHYLSLFRVVYFGKMSVYSPYLENIYFYSISSREPNAALYSIKKLTTP